MDPQLQKAYEVRARQAHRWHDHARNFICAANRLVEWYVPVLSSHGPPDLERWHASFQPIMLLFGLATENLLKALLVAQGVDPLSAGVLNSTFKTHDLGALAQRGGIPLSMSERELLERLRDFIESSKYPIGISADKGLGGNRFEYPSDVDQTWALLQRLDDAVRTAPPSALGSVDVKTLCRS